MQIQGKQRLASLLMLFTGIGALALLLRMAGPPSSHLQVLADLASPMAEPLIGVLAALALGAQALAAYLVFVFGLRALTYLPGIPGQVADHAAHLLTVPAIRRGLDALLGGALIAYLALTPASTGAGIGTIKTPPPPVATASAQFERGSWSAPAPPAVAPESRGIKASAFAPSSPPVPPPIWLGGHLVPSEPPCPSRPRDGAARPDSVDEAHAVPIPAPAARMGGPAPAATADDSSRPPTGPPAAHHTVEPRDTLWRIAAAHLPADVRREATLAVYWRQIYGANRDALGSDPNLIHPGVTLAVPPYAPSASVPLSPGTPQATSAPASSRSGGVAEDPLPQLP
jgi:hypothetical protein